MPKFFDIVDVDDHVLGHRATIFPSVVVPAFHKFSLRHIKTDF